MWDIATATLKKQFETTEEVWDLAVSEKYLYSIRDRDLLIQTHLKQVKRTLEGRGPVCRINEKIYMATRDGLGIQIYDDNDGFALINTLQVNSTSVTWNTLLSREVRSVGATAGYNDLWKPHSHKPMKCQGVRANFLMRSEAWNLFFQGLVPSFPNFRIWVTRLDPIYKEQQSR